MFGETGLCSVNCGALRAASGAEVQAEARDEGGHQLTQRFDCPSGPAPHLFIHLTPSCPSVWESPVVKALWKSCVRDCESGHLGNEKKINLAHNNTSNKILSAGS